MAVWSSALHAQAAHQITLVNQTTRPIARIFVSGAGDADWGTNKLATPSLPPHERVQFIWHGPCHADLRIVFDNHAAEEKPNLDVCTGEVSIAPGWTTQTP